MSLYNIMRMDKITRKKDFLPHNGNGWIDGNSSICRKVLTESQANFERSMFERNNGNEFWFLTAVNNMSRRTFPICHISDNTGTNADLDTEIHKGFTIGKGKMLYWEMIWHGSGHVTVFSKDSKRWIPGDTQITIHFK